MVLAAQWEKRFLLSFLAGVSFMIIKDFPSTALENHSSFLNVIPTLHSREKLAGFWTCCAAAAFSCWCRSGRGTAGFAKVKSPVFLLFLLSLYFPTPPVPYTVAVELNTTLFMLWTPPSMFRFPILQVLVDWMNEFFLQVIPLSHSKFSILPGGRFLERAWV